MADKQNSSPRDSGAKKAPPRRNDVIRCENCGEDYAITYKRCPFCDERPGRAGGIVSGGRRVANTRGGGYGRPINPIQVAGLVISLIVIIAALVIVVRFISGPLLSGKGSTTSSGEGSVSTSQSGSQGSSASASQSGSTSQTGGAEVESISLNGTEYTLQYDETFAFVATVTPEGVEEPVVWTSSNPEVLTIDEKGNVKNVNTGSSVERVTVTATCGGMQAECVVYCRAQNPGSTSSGQSGSGTGTSGGGTSTGTVTSGSKGTIINADGGLNIRSGPGTSYDKVASASNGAEVTVLGEENGWYKIKYNNTDVGYVSKEYVSVS